MKTAVFALVLATGVSAQKPLPAIPAFEVATVKRSPPPSGDTININIGTVRNSTLTFANASLSDCLRFAYGLVSDAQIAGPGWIKSKSVRFDIVAKAAAGTDREHLALMLRTLLAERLKLSFHFEQQEMSYLALVIGKKGLKLRPAPANAPPAAGPAVDCRIVRSSMALAQLVTLLSRFERQTVVDQTGLHGLFAVDLQWTPETQHEFPPNGAGDHPSLFTAVQEELGLRLVSTKGPLPVLVVDHAEQIPAEN
jgi:uncharacterized protein (TIGR03435 family)